MIEVILMERIERLGQFGQVVKVRPGYARNYLLPQRKAMRATKANMEIFEKERAHMEAHNAKLRADAESSAKGLEGLNLMLIRQASESGQLYGSVTARDIAESAEATGQKIERRAVEIAVPIKTIGLFPVKIKLHPEVSVTITVNIARSEEEGHIKQQQEAAREAKEARAAAEMAVPAQSDSPVAAAPGEETPSPEAEAKPTKKRASKKKAAAEDSDA